MTNLQVDYDIAQSISSDLRAAKTDLEEDESTMPSDVDGGDGTEYILNMIAQLAEEAGIIAQASELGASKMSTGIDLVSGVDESVAAELREMEGNIP